jgi:hypothetical protein
MANLDDLNKSLDDIIVKLERIVELQKIVLDNNAELQERDAVEHCVERSETGPTVTEELAREERAACEHIWVTNDVIVFCIGCGEIGR